MSIFCSVLGSSHCQGQPAFSKKVRTGFAARRMGCPAADTSLQDSNGSDAHTPVRAEPGQRPLRLMFSEENAWPTRVDNWIGTEALPVHPRGI